MKERNFIIFLMLILLATSVLAQEDLIRIRFYSVLGSTTLELEKYLPDGPYYSTESSNIIIEIDQIEKTAKLTAKPGWDGVEEVAFSTDPLKVNKTIIAQGKMVDIIKETKEAQLAVKKDLTKEVSELLKEGIDPKLLNEFLSTIKKQEIENIYSGLLEKGLLVNIDNLAKFEVDLENKTEPEFAIDIIAAPNGTLDLDALKVNKKTIFSLALFVIFAGFICFILILAYLKASIFTKQVISERNKKLFFVKHLRHIEFIDKQKQVRALFWLIKKFFRIYFKLNKDSTYYELNRVLKITGITGDLKQELFFLFRKCLKQNISETNPKLIIRSLRDVLNQIE